MSFCLMFVTHKHQPRGDKPKKHTQTLANGVIKSSVALFAFGIEEKGHSLLAYQT